MTTFKIGDEVSWMGYKGVINSISDNCELPIRVEFPNGSCCYFTTDGRNHTEHTEPSLKLINRPKKIKLCAFLSDWGSLYWSIEKGKAYKECVDCGYKRLSSLDREVEIESDE